MSTFRLEVRTGQDIREVPADFWKEDGRWMVFYRRPPQGGTQEYFRIQLADVVSMEIKP